MFERFSEGENLEALLGFCYLPGARALLRNFGVSFLKEVLQDSSNLSELKRSYGRMQTHYLQQHPVFGRFVFGARPKYRHVTRFMLADSLSNVLKYFHIA